MRPGANLQLSCYLTLTLAAVCLAFADMFFLWWMPGFVAVVVLAFAVAWRNEGRWQLSESAANTLGLFIAFGMLWWIIYQLPRDEEELMAAGVPWPAGLLPHLAPLLMLLTAVKLFRPKRMSDFWGLQVLGIMMVTLASVLAGDIEHGIWVGLYLVSGIWCLTCFYRRQHSLEPADPVGARHEVALFETDATLPRQCWAGLGQATAFAAAIVVLGGLMFVVVPRHSSAQWVPHKLTTAMSGRITMGFDEGMDLNRTGKVELSDEVAFEVTPIEASGRTISLPDSTYWRCETLESYRNGRWYTATLSSDDVLPDFIENPGDPAEAIRLEVLWVPDLLGKRPPSIRPDDVADDKTYLVIHALPKLGGNLPLAEPVDIEAGIGLLPYVGERPSRSGLFAYLNGTDTILPQGRRTNYVYGQVFDSGASGMTQIARRIQPKYLQTMLTQSPPEDLTRWSRELLKRVAGLTADERMLDNQGQVAVKNHEAVGRAIANHFSASGEYLYTLNRRRVDATIDPNLDFLCNVKEGHCERYASGLALTLRGLGVPCRIVRGFRGVESTEEGTSRVRLNQAHSWVQALVPRANAEGYNWILLDATPSREAPLDRWQATLEWISDSLRFARAIFRNSVLEYSSEQQSSNLRAWWDYLKNSDLLLPIACVFALSIMGLGILRFGREPLARWRAARVANRADRTPWMTDALASIRQATGVAPAANATFLEFAESLNDDLRAPFAELVQHAQRVRYGEQILSTQDHDAVRDALSRLKSRCVTYPPRGRIEIIRTRHCT